MTDIIVVVTPTDISRALLEKVVLSDLYFYIGQG